MFVHVCMHGNQVNRVNELRCPYQAYIRWQKLLSTVLLHLGFIIHTTWPIWYLHICSGRSKDQKLVDCFLKIGLFVGYLLASHWKCTVSVANQNRFWLATCWNWSENGGWSAAISSTIYGTMHGTIHVLLHHTVLINMYMHVYVYVHVHKHSTLNSCHNSLVSQWISNLWISSVC